MPGSTKNTEHVVFLGLGSNISPDANLPRALDLLRASLQIVNVSRAWNTPAVGTVGPDFLNAAVMCRTDLSSSELKIKVLRKIENQLGRIRTEDKNAPRTIDIDILIFDNELFEPQIWSQAHLAVPLAELIPTYSRPESEETLAQVAQRLYALTPIHALPDLLGG